MFKRYREKFSSLFKMAAKEDDEEEGAVCRICFLGDYKDNPLIRVCMCKGSIEFHHQGCISEWVKDPKHMVCNMCGYEMTVTQQKLERKISWENYKESWYEVMRNGLSVEERKKKYCIDITLTLQAIFLCLFFFLDWCFNDRNMVKQLRGSKTGQQCLNVYVLAYAVLIGIYLKLLMPKVWKKMREDRFIQVVKEIA